jgi:hypothetical protein
MRKTLNVSRLNDTISKCWDSWFNHIRRMDHSRFPRYMLSYKPTRKRSRGRPRKRWISQVWGAATGQSPMHEVEVYIMILPCSLLTGQEHHSFLCIYF